MSILFDQNVSDADASKVAALLEMPESTRIHLWRERYDNIGTLQGQFTSADHYTAFMEGVCSGRVRIIALARSGKYDQDAARRAQARRLGLSDNQRVKLWHDVFQSSSSIQTEFQNKEVYSGFMEGELARGR